MNASVKCFGMEQHSTEECVALAEEIRDSVAPDHGAVPLTEAQREELQKRVAEDDANPHDVTSWDQVKASTLSRFGK